MLKLLLIAIGGGIGTLLRYFLSGYVHDHWNGVFPSGTLAVNMAGCFAVGFLWEVFDRFTFSSDAKVCVFVGIIGGFTTFSTYMLETVNLMRAGEDFLAMWNLVVSTVGGVALVVLGFLSSRFLIGFYK